MKMGWNSFGSPSPSNLSQQASPEYGPRKTILVCLFTGGDPGDKPNAEYKADFQQNRMAAVEAAWADADVVSLLHRFIEPPPP